MGAKECLKRRQANGHKARVEKFRVPSLGKTASIHTHTHTQAQNTHTPTHTNGASKEQEQGQLRGQRIKEKKKFSLL